MTNSDPSVLFSLEKLAAYEDELRAAGQAPRLAMRLPQEGASGFIDLQRLCREGKIGEAPVLIPEAAPIVPVDDTAERAKTRTLLMVGVAALCGAAVVLATMAVAEPPPIVVRYVTAP